MRLAKTAWLLVKESFTEWMADKSPRLGAALSYYTVFSLAPVLLVVIAIGFLLLVSLALSAALAAVSGWLSDLMPGWLVLGYVLNYGVSLFVIAAFFALLFKVLPDAQVAWRDVWVGALVTSL